jgi:DNA segregation ATPase FtsK/SpoIIIE, S-DNA-T family
MPRRKKKKPIILNIRKETMFSIAAVVMILIGILIIISFSGQGVILATINNYLATNFGVASLFLPFVFIACGLVLFQADYFWAKPHVLLGTVLMMLGSLGMFKSGAVGSSTFLNVSQLITPLGANVLFISILVIGVLIMMQLSLSEVLEWMGEHMPKPKYVPPTEQDELDLQQSAGFQMPKFGFGSGFGAKQEPAFAVNEGERAAEVEQPEPVKAKDKKDDKKSKKDEKELPGMDNVLASLNPDAVVTPQPVTTNDPSHVWEYPPLTLLSDKAGGEANRGDVKQNAQIIERTLASFGIKARVAEVNYGPAVTQYALEIALGTKLSKITGLATDLALALAAPTGQIRIEAPIAGRALVGVEVPNHSAQFVTLRTMLQSDKMKKHNSKLAVALGLNVAGQEVVADIGKMPHVLIAGSTGSGKSVAVNTFMCSMLFRASPAEVKFILVDPKRVELTGYNDIPHLLTPVIVEPSKVVSALKWACAEMDRRYKQLAEVGVKNLEAYNELAGFQALPSIVIIIDELADIMLFAPAEVEESVTRIAQMARAVGIHLVLATQRPSVDVITGLIKANVPTRIAFNVASLMDSRVILDAPGAEKLLGKGDMLYVPPDQAKPTRIQGTFVSEPEIRKLVDFVKGQGQKPEYQEEITTKYQGNTVKGGSGGNNGEDRDPLFNEAVKIFSQYDKASSSLIQRRLSVGYARAARILDQLYEAGLVGPAEGSKPREVNLVKVREHLTKVAAAG